MLILKGEMVKCTPQRPYHTSCGRDATKNFGLFVPFLDNIDFSSETLVVVLGHFAHFHLFNITGTTSNNLIVQFYAGSFLKSVDQFKN